MNTLNIPFIPLLTAESDFGDIDKQLDSLTAHNLDYLLWSNNIYKPKVSFAIAHSGHCIFLRYTVFENNIRAVCNNPNDPVYQDSCVEFFIGIENDVNYYNLEFNCLGTCTIGYGNDRHNRTLVSAYLINGIKTQTKLERINGGFVYRWDLTLAIPVVVFIHHKNVDLAGLKCRLNFYKCGDELPQPHFIAWNKIEAEQPNFHLSQFFGTGLFLNGR